MMEMEMIPLRSGVLIPAIGFGPGIMGGTLKINDKDSRFISLIRRASNKLIFRPVCKKKFVKSIANAFCVGFRLLDYSNAYKNQELIEKAIRKSGIPREQLVLTSRVTNRAQFTGRVRDEFFETLAKWKVDKIDILQFHWPVSGKYVDTWREMIKLKEEGYVRILGVANCHQHHIEELERDTGVLPEINQIEVHPLFTQKPLLEYCRAKNIVVEAYTPIGRYDDRLVRLPLLKHLEEKYKKSFIQIILRWHIQNGVVPVVRALNPKHQKDNIDVFDFILSNEDMALIDGINIDSRLRYHPDNCDFTIL